MSRYVYELQDPGAPALTADESDSSTEYDSEDAEARRRQTIRHTEKWRRRMSILSNNWYDLPPALDLHEHSVVDVDERMGLKQRSLFDSGLSWDHNAGQAVVNRFTGLISSTYAGDSDDLLEVEDDDVYGPTDDAGLDDD